MLSANNILSPAHGCPLATPTQDMVLGSYFLTYSTHDLTVGAEALKKELKVDGFKRFQNEEEVESPTSSPARSASRTRLSTAGTASWS